MLNSMFYIKDGFSRLKHIMESVDKDKKREESKVDHNIVKINIIKSIADIYSGFKELSYADCYVDDHVPAVARNAYMYMTAVINNDFENMTDIYKMVDIIRPSVTMAKDVENSEYESLLSYRYDTDKRRNIEYGYRMDSGYIQALSDAIVPAANKSINVLITNNFNIEPIITMITDDYQGDKKFYVNTTNGYLINDETREKCERVAVGDFLSVTGTNDCFDLVICSALATVTKNEVDTLKRADRRHIVKAFSYLAVGGHMVIILPIFCLRNDICLFISKNFDDVNIRYANSFVYISGKKRGQNDRVIDDDLYYELRTLILRTDNELINKYQPVLQLPKVNFPVKEVEVKMFSGNKIDDGEMPRMYMESPCVEQCFNNQTTKAITDETRRPLLPFNIGQLGLILTSGCLDGVVTDDYGYSHVVKGRIVKDKTSTVESVNDTTDHIKTVEYNKVQIEMFLPDGTYKKLA